MDKMTEKEAIEKQEFVFNPAERKGRPDDFSRLFDRMKTAYPDAVRDISIKKDDNRRICNGLGAWWGCRRELLDEERWFCPSCYLVATGIAIRFIQCFLLIAVVTCIYYVAFSMM